MRAVKGGGCPPGGEVKTFQLGPKLSAMTDFKFQVPPRQFAGPVTPLDKFLLRQKPPAPLLSKGVLPGFSVA